MIGVVELPVARGPVSATDGVSLLVGSQEEVPVAHAPAERGADGGDLDAEGGVEVHVCGDAVFVELRLPDEEYLHAEGLVLGASYIRSDLILEAREAGEAGEAGYKRQAGAGHGNT